MPDPITPPPAGPMPQPPEEMLSDRTPLPQLETFKQGFVRGAAGPQYATDEQGNVVPLKPNVQPTKGGTFGSILAGMVVGALQGATAARPGGIPSHELGGGVGAGAKAIEDYLLKQDLLKRQEAQQNFQNQQAVQQASRLEAESAAQINQLNASTHNMVMQGKWAEEEHPQIVAAKQLGLENQALQLQDSRQQLFTGQLKLLSTLSENGVDPTTMVTSWQQAGEHAKSLGRGDTLAIWNGKSGDDQGAGMFSVSDLKSATLQKPATFSTWTADSKGDPVEEKHTLQPGTSLMEYVMSAMNGQAQLNRILGRQKLALAAETEKAKTIQARAEAGKAQAQTELTKAQANMMKDMGVTDVGNYAAGAEDWKLSPDQLRQKMTNSGMRLSPLVSQNLPALLALADYTAKPDTFPTRVYNRPGQVPQIAKQQAIAFVKMIRPDWDERTYNATQKLYNDFANTSRGSAGGRMASFDAATRHLGMAAEAAQALQNGNVPLFNQFSQHLAQETGQPPPQNFDAIKNVLVGEVGFLLTGKSITDQEAKTMEASINRAQSPQQLAGVIQTYAHAMLAKDAAQIDQFVAWTGKLPPNYLSPATLDVYRKLGIDVNAALGIPEGVGMASTGNRTGAAQVNPKTTGAVPLTSNYGGKAVQFDQGSKRWVYQGTQTAVPGIPAPVMHNGQLWIPNPSMGTWGPVGQ